MVLLRGFCYGRSASDVAKVTSAWAVEHGEKRVSRKTVSKYFVLLGEHLFNSYEDAHLFDEVFMDELWELLYDEKELDKATREALSREGILAYVHTLQRMSKINHGLDRKNLAAHFGHAIFLTVAFQEYGQDCTQRFYDSIVHRLEKQPLRAK